MSITKRICDWKWKGGAVIDILTHILAEWHRCLLSIEKILFLMTYILCVCLVEYVHAHACTCVCLN